uniref:Uncharacterized protein n=1 Tax=Cacopsylla melanoneura TaxID=428564 RepID=A0A8D9BYR6_9HEMI
MDHINKIVLHGKRKENCRTFSENINLFQTFYSFRISLINELSLSMKGKNISVQKLKNNKSCPPSHLLLYKQRLNNKTFHRKKSRNSCFSKSCDILFEKKKKVFLFCF